MNIFDRYIFKNLSIAALFITVILVVLIFLTQSLRFLELVVESGASTISFLILTLLALPRFFEVILPLSLTASVLFVYNRMSGDSELSVIRSLGRSPMMLAKPVLILSFGVTIFLWFITMWAAPKSVAQMQYARQVVKAQFSSMLLRGGVFNKINDDVTVYIREKSGDYDLKGILIHDQRPDQLYPSTITAKNGLLVLNEDQYEVVVFNGTRQSYDPVKNILQLLKFDRYVVQLPDGGPIRQRWPEPSERTIFQLLMPDLNDERDVDNLGAFTAEIHKRIVGPLLALSFPLISVTFMVLGPASRKGKIKNILAALFIILVLQSLFLMLFSTAKQHFVGILLMYVLVLGPAILSYYLLSRPGEKLWNGLRMGREGISRMGRKAS